MMIGGRKVLKMQIGETTVFDESEDSEKWERMKLGDTCKGIVFGRLNRSASTISLWGFVYFNNGDGWLNRLIIPNDDRFKFNIKSYITQNAQTGVFSNDAWGGSLKSDSNGGLDFSVSDSAPKVDLSTILSAQMGYLNPNKCEPADIPVTLTD